MTRALLIAAILLPALAFAGAHGGQEVYIDQQGQSAQGVLSSARNSADPLQYIGCAQWVVSSNGTNQVSLACWAVDSKGNYAQCWTDEPAYLEAARSLNGDSLLLFNWDANGKCRQLAVYNTSVYEPK